MPFYFRKSIRVGPVRFNLSKSGIGASIGIKGLRLGTGPRGNYIHAGAGGLYYRASLDSPNSKANPIPRRDYQPQEHEGMIAIESGSASGMVHEDSADLLTELRSKKKRFRRWPILFVLVIVCSIIASQSGLGASFVAAGGGIGFLLVWIVSLQDKLYKTTVLFYDLEDGSGLSYERFISAFETLISCDRFWHIEAKGGVRDGKYQAGASAVVDRKRIYPKLASPPYVKTNIPVAMIPAGEQSLFFFPDRILVFDRNDVGAIGYSDLNVDFTEQRFIEVDSVPRDAKIVGQTWKFVNKSGGPDRRFNNNYEIPIALYAELHLSTRSGLNEKYQLSHLASGHQFKDVIRRLGGEAQGSEKLSFKKTISPTSVPPTNGRSPVVSERALGLIADRRQYWEYLLTADLLRINLGAVQDGYASLRLELQDSTKATFDRSQFVDWLSQRLGMLQQLLEDLGDTIKNQIPASWGPPGVAGNPDDIKRAAFAVIHLCYSLLDWERELASAKAPRGFQKLKRKMEGWTVNVFKEICRIPDEIERPFLMPNPQGQFTINLRFDPPPNIQEISYEIERLRQSVP